MEEEISTNLLQTWTRIANWDLRLLNPSHDARIWYINVENGFWALRGTWHKTTVVIEFLNKLVAFLRQILKRLDCIHFYVKIHIDTLRRFKLNND